jgi:hypothetical protein
MSGSSSNYSFETGATQKNCADIVLRTQLASPDPEVIEELGIGDILNIRLSSATGPLQAVTIDGIVAGAILSSNPALLINCINEGYEYIAKVLSVNGGDCQVSIYCDNR